jgi:integrase
MPANLPFTYVIRKKSGTELWYFRHPTLPKAKRILGVPGEPRFHREHARLLAAALEERDAEVQRQDEKSIRWLTEQYQASDEWNRLKASTKKSYERELARLNAMVGDLPFARLSGVNVRQLRSLVIKKVVADREEAIERRKAEDADAEAKGIKGSRRKLPKPTNGLRTGDLFKSVLAAMFGWAARYGMVDDNPAAKVEKLQRKKDIESYIPWSEPQIAHVLREAAPHVRDGVIVGLSTGQRLIDCVLMTKANAFGGDVRVFQEKTGNFVDVPVTGPLVDLVRRRKSANDPSDCDRLMVQPNGNAYSERTFSNHLRDELDRLGFPELSFHGLRYAAAGRLLEAGCSLATVSDITGHSSVQMAEKYATARERRGKAIEAMEAAAAKIEEGVS